MAPATDERGAWNIEGLAARITAVLRGMVGEGTLREAELARMVVPVYHRRAAEFEAPFADPGLGLVVEERSLDRVPDPLWGAFRASGDAAALAVGYAGFARAAFGPTLARALDPDRSADDRRAFVARLEAGLKVSTIAEPAALCAPVVMTMLIAKPRRSDETDEPF